MNTDAFTDRLSEYLDDELPATERASVEAHLAECAALPGDARGASDGRGAAAVA